MQLTIPFAPKSDTSRDAAKSVCTRIGPDARKVLDAILSVRGGMTCDEVERCLGMRHQTASARVNGLRDAGIIIDSGCRRPTSSGRKAVVWVAA